jgi:pyruvate dehydrogenase E1 component alpha subunit
LRRYILDNKLAKEDQLKDIENDIKSIMNDAVEFSQTSPEPYISELYTDILIDN